MYKTSQEITMVQKWVFMINLTNNCKLTISFHGVTKKMLVECNRANNRTFMMNQIWQPKESKSTALLQKIPENTSLQFSQTRMPTRMTIKLSMHQIWLI